MRVLKFGGAALRDGPSVEHAARIVREHGGPRPLVVVSAHYGVTELLVRALARARAGELEWDPLRVRHRTLLRQLDLPAELLDRHLRELRGTLESIVRDGRDDRRIRDFVLSFGERMSARVFAAHLRRSGTAATPLDAHDLGLRVRAGRTPTLGPPHAERERLERLFADVPGIPVVTGFFALDEEGHLATLGPNGSDLTAAWFGAALGADRIELWKRVRGLTTADPALIPGAAPIERIGWSEAEALARHGARVLHPASVAPARGALVPIELRDFDRPDSPGTRIHGDRVPGVTAIAHREDVAELVVTLGDPGDVGGARAGTRAARLARLFETLHAAGVEVYLGSFGLDRARLLVPDDPELLEDVLAALPEAQLARGWSTVAVISEAPVEPASLGGDLSDALGARRFHADVEGGAEEEHEDVFLVPRGNLPRFARDLHDRIVTPVP